MAENRAGAAVWVATCAGIGFFPVAPGTLGAALGLGLVAATGQLPITRPWMSVCLSGAAGAIFFLGAWASGEAEKSLGGVDPSAAIIDEVFGQMITFLAWPQASWKLLLAGFALFRICDVVKPFPARRAEKTPGGWGIMLDDAVAGAYSLGLLWVWKLAVR